MTNKIITSAVRTLFAATSRDKALKEATAITEKYLQVSENVTDQLGRIPVKVPLMRGLDEDMRNWSLFMLLEHNTIVNRSITATVCQLANGESLHGAATIDPKTEVMPSESPGIEQIQLFRDSVSEHAAAINKLPDLRKTAKSPHPVFGQFNAHDWNCMFFFHLKLHYPQALRIKSAYRK